MRRHHPDRSGMLGDLFAHLDTRTQNALRGQGTVHTLEPGEILESVQECVVRVDEGFVRLAVTTGQRSLTVGLYGTGDWIVSPMYHSWENKIYVVQAQEGSEVLTIPREAVLKVAEKSPEFMRGLFQQMSWGDWSRLQTIYMLAFHTLPQRIAQSLVNLAAMFGYPGPKRGLKIGLRFTQDELAEIACARRETLSTVLQEFREEDILDLRYARIDIRDPEALRHVAGIGALPFIKQDEAVAAFLEKKS